MNEWLTCMKAELTDNWGFFQDGNLILVVVLTLSTNNSTICSYKYKIDHPSTKSVMASNKIIMT